MTTGAARGFLVSQFGYHLHCHDAGQEQVVSFVGSADHWAPRSLGQVGGRFCPFPLRTNLAHDMPRTSMNRPRGALSGGDCGD